jgi:hypothetical protein
MKKVLTDAALAKSISEEGLKLRQTISISEISKKWINTIDGFVE